MTRKILGLVGLKGSGKSTLAALLVSEFNYVRAPLAGPLKSMIRELLNVQQVDRAGIDDMLEGSSKEIPTRFLGDKSPRVAMQTLGTEWGRQLISPTLWIDVWTEAAKRTSASLVVDDVRFHNECARIRSLGGHIVRIIRESHQASADRHISEMESGDLAVDWTITNYERQPEEMVKQIEGWL